MSIEKTPQPFPTFFIPLAFFVSVLAFILILVGSLLLIVLPLVGAIIAGIAAFSAILLTVHYVIYKNEWGATTALRKLESKLPELRNIAYARGGQAYKPHLVLTNESVSSFFTMLEELLGKTGKVGARIVSMQAMQSLNCIFNFMDHFFMSIDGEQLTKETLLFELDLLYRLLALCSSSVILYNDSSKISERISVYEISKNLIVLMGRMILLFSVEYDKPGEINQGEVNCFYLDTNKIIKFLSLMYPVFFDSEKVAIVGKLIDLCAELENLPSLDNSYSRRISKSNKSGIEKETFSKIKITQQLILKELKRLKDDNQIPEQQINAVNKLIEKYPLLSNEDFSFDRPFSSSDPTNSNSSQKLENHSPPPTPHQ